LNPTRIVTFGVACRGCPLRNRCTASSSGRSVKVHEHETLQRAHRARAQAEAFGYWLVEVDEESAYIVWEMKDLLMRARGT
jgi:uncharacterized protein (UPF0179 family)